uniref:Uncharacterized protein n=2 Tax=Cajanus cajan TaxID=3821 RepID=A0A151REV1_CAJCA|nr:hypothetical protein KK1_037454 [Cajanus cajan]
MRYALNAGCSYSRQRGNFNWADYIEGETNNAPKFPIVNRSHLFILVAAAVYLM